MTKALSSQADEKTRNDLRRILDLQSRFAIASASRDMGLREDTSSILAQTSIPILIITGDQDILIPPQESKNMHELARNSKLIIINNAGHLSSFEQAALWNQAVIDFFNHSNQKPRH